MTFQQSLFKTNIQWNNFSSMLPSHYFEFHIFMVIRQTYVKNSNFSSAELNDYFHSKGLSDFSEIAQIV